MVLSAMPRGIEPAEDATDVVIDLGYHGVIAVARGAQFVVGKVLWTSAGVEGWREGRQRQSGWIVEIEEFWGATHGSCGE